MGKNVFYQVIVAGRPIVPLRTAEAVSQVVNDVHGSAPDVPISVRYVEETDVTKDFLPNDKRVESPRNSDCVE